MSPRHGEEKKGFPYKSSEQRILEFAAKRGLRIGEWFEEQVSAAKRGRPVFSKLVAHLKKKQAAGLIIHKIDRGARNLRDWADMADLMDSGMITTMKSI